MDTDTLCVDLSRQNLYPLGNNNMDETDPDTVISGRGNPLRCNLDGELGFSQDIPVDDDDDDDDDDSEGDAAMPEWMDG